MNETLIRVLTAVVLVPIVLAGLHFGGIWWVGLAALVAFLALREFYGLVEAKGYAPFRRAGYVGGLVLMLAAWQLRAESILFVLTVMILGVFFAQLARRSVTTAIPNISATIVGILYIPWLLAQGILMRGITFEGTNIGEGLIVFCLATTFLADTGGYFFGRTWGKHKIIPSVSPKKSWEGLLGSLIFSALGGVAVIFVYNKWMTPLPIAYWLGALIGIANSVIGLSGDLIESVMKRDAEVKDTGSLLPGHGGMLDRIDGLIFTLPVNYQIFVLLFSYQA